MGCKESDLTEKLSINALFFLNSMQLAGTESKVPAFIKSIFCIVYLISVYPKCSTVHDYGDAIGTLLISYLESVIPSKPSLPH